MKNNNIKFPVAGIGASAGGLDAFKALIKTIPTNSGIAWVLVQHQHPDYESMLTAFLQKLTTLPVIEITNNLTLKPDHIYVMPVNKMVTVKEGNLKLSPRPAKAEVAMNYSINLFFRTLAQAYESYAIGIVLSGTGNDGTEGLKSIKAHGGFAIAQSIESAAYPGMPQSAVDAGVVDFILHPHEIPQKIEEIKLLIGINEKEDELEQKEEMYFKDILSQLHSRKGMDFTYYKQSTIRRRILRRMVLNKFKQIDHYAAYVAEDENEIHLLYQDLLIPVTNFFRDTKVFNNLCDTVFPKLIKNKTPEGHIRIWVAGCSTGEEAYSIAICFKEYLGHKQEKVQIFATDLSEPAITKARAGIYSKSEAESVSPGRIKKFFTVYQGNYIVKKELRDMCVFAVHNFLQDPPFGKIDFISCRNVLIYMDTYLQKKALAVFHYALNPDGLLMLGKSENTIGITDLFELSSKADKIFIRKNRTTKNQLFSTQKNGTTSTSVRKAIIPETTRTDFQKLADDVLQAKYTPASVVINEAMDILYFRGDTSLYLQQQTGKPTHNLLKMARTDLVFELRSILNKTIKEKKAVKKENIPVQLKNEELLVTLEAIPLNGMVEPHWLIIFDDLIKNKSRTVSRKSLKINSKDEAAIRIQQLEQELAQVKEDIRIISNEQEASNEELQSTNEELLSSNEELQSLNEELETSKEELQSTIEELSVVNIEMANLNEQLTAERDFAEALIATVPQSMLILDKELRVTSANQLFYEKFSVTASQTEGKLIFEIGNHQWNIPELRRLLESILPQQESFLGLEVEHEFETIGHRIMRLNAREIVRENSHKKILLVIEDVTDYVLAARKIQETEHRYSRMIHSSPYMIAILEGENLVIKEANEPLLKSWQKGREIIGQPLLEALPEAAIIGSETRLKKVYETGEPYYGNEVLVKSIRNGKPEDVYYSFVYQAQKDINGHIEGVAILAHEVTPQAIFNKQIKESEKKFNSIFQMAEVSLWEEDFSLVKQAIEELKNEPISDYRRYFEEHPEFVEKAIALIKVTDVNAHTVKTFEATSKEELLGSLTKIFTPQTVPVFVEELVAIAEGRTHLQAESILRTLKGNILHIIFTIKFPEPDESFNRVVVSILDITERKKVEDALKESQEQFSTLADNMENLAWLADGSGSIYWYNKRWLEYTGLTQDEMLGWGWQKVHHPDHVERIVELAKKLWITNQSFELTFPLRRHDGEFRWFLTRGYPLTNDEGTIIRWIGTNTDITTQIETEQKLSELSTIVESSADAIISKTLDSIITTWNKGAENIFGYTASEAIGQPVTILIPEELLDEEHLVIGTIKQGKSVIHHQTVRLAKDGRKVHVSLTISPIRDKDGNIIGASKIAKDITEQVIARRKIEESEELFRKLSDQAPMWVWLTDKDFNILYANPALLQYLGIEHYTEFTGLIWDQKVHPQDVALVYDALGKAALSREGFVGEYRILNAASGEFEWFYIKGVPRYEENEFTGFIGTGININEQKIAQAQLEYRTALLEAHNEASIDGILLVDTKGKILSYNNRFAEIWNMPSHILQSKDDEGAIAFAITQLTRPEQFSERIKWLYENTDKISVDELVFKNGKIIERHGYPVKAPNGTYYAWSWVFRDVTEERTAALKIQESEKYFRHLTDTVPTIIWIIEPDGKCSYINKTWYDYTGQKENEAEGFGWLTAIHPDDVEAAGKEFMAANAAQKNVELLYRLRTKNGNYRWVKDSGSPRFSEDGTYEGMIGTVVDVHEETIATSQIKESEKRFRLLADSMPQFIWTADAQGNLNYFNRAVFNYSGLTIEQLEKDGWLQIVHPDEREENLKKWQHSISTGTEFIFEHRFKKYDGEYRWQLSRAVPQKDAEGNIQLWVGASTDIQAIKEEEQRKGDFIKMVSHELKTPVTSIKGYVQFLLSILNNQAITPEMMPVKSSLSRIDVQIVRLTRLITEMLDLSRIESGKLELQKKQFSLNQLVTETVHDFSHTSSTHRLIVQDEFTCDIIGDRDRLEQVLTNFINNAIKYSPENNIINIRVFNWGQHHAAVSVQDFGIGISPEEQQKIFERFYRVSGRNESTYSGFGIGLFIANEIVQKHHGTIKVQSEEGKGSIFTFILPLPA